MPRFRNASLPAFTTAMIGVLAIGGFAIGAFTIGAGEPPSSATPAAEPISRAEQQIRDAIEGKSTGETGNGLLDDVLGVIRQRRSILDDSSLDDIIDIDAETTGEPPSVSNMALAAEQMLKAARLLENVGTADQDRADLVKRMRAEAVKLLSE